MNAPHAHQERHAAAARLKAAREALECAERRAAFWERWYQGAFYVAINGNAEDREECEHEFIVMQEAARVAETEDEELIARLIVNDPQGAKYEFH